MKIAVMTVCWSLLVAGCCSGSSENGKCWINVPDGFQQLSGTYIEELTTSDASSAAGSGSLFVFGPLSTMYSFASPPGSSPTETGIYDIGDHSFFIRYPDQLSEMRVCSAIMRNDDENDEIRLSVDVIQLNTSICAPINTSATTWRYFKP